MTQFVLTVAYLNTAYISSKFFLLASLASVLFYSLYLNIPGKFMIGVLESPGKGLLECNCELLKGYRRTADKTISH